MSYCCTYDKKYIHVLAPFILLCITLLFFYMINTNVYVCILFSECTCLDWDKDGDVLAVTQDKSGMILMCTRRYTRQNCTGNDKHIVLQLYCKLLFKYHGKMHLSLQGYVRPLKFP